MSGTDPTVGVKKDFSRLYEGFEEQKLVDIEYEFL
jgi:hypothetical protein